MKKIINKSLLVYLLISISLLFYRYGSNVDFDSIARFLYFTKDNFLIAMLAAASLVGHKIKSKALSFAILTFTSSLIVYEYLLINLNNVLYADMIRSPLASVILALIPIGSYQIYKLYHNDNGKYKQQSKCSKRIKSIYNRVKGLIQKKSRISNN